MASSSLPPDETSPPPAPGKVLVSPTHRDSPAVGEHEDESGNIDHLMPSKFYATRGALKEEIERRHDRFGYDPLDRALMEQREQFELKKSLKSKMTPGFMKKARNPHEEYEHNVKRLLRDHLDTMESLGIAFHHDFQNEKLGFSILVARYGTEGRKFVQVDETMPHSECYPEPLKPTDELISVNGKLILDPEEGEKFKVLQDTISKSQRPLRLTFIHGERREEAFLEQETRRAFFKCDRPNCDPSPLRASSEKLLNKALEKLESLKKAAALGDDSTADDSIASIEAALSAVRTRDEEAKKRVGDDRYTKSMFEVEETKMYVAHYLEKMEACAQEARGLVADMRTKLERDKVYIDDAARAAGRATAAREATEAAAETGDVRTAEQGVDDALEAEKEAYDILKKVEDPELGCFERTITAVSDSAALATDERQRAQAARYMAVASHARKRAEESKNNMLGVDGLNRSIGDEDEVDTGDVDDALSRINDLLGRVRKDPKASDETKQRVEDAAKKIAGDRRVAESAKYVAAATTARVAAENAGENGDADGAEAAAQKAVDADDAHKRLNEAAKDDNLDEADTAALEKGAREATEQRDLAQAAAWAARAAATGEDTGDVDDALSRVRGLLNRVKNDPNASGAHKAAIAALAAGAVASRHVNDSETHAAATAAARKRAEDAAEAGDADGAASHADAAKVSAVAMAAVASRVAQDDDAKDSTKVTVAAMAGKAATDERVAEAAKWSAATTAARKKAEEAAEKGDVIKATEAADDASGYEKKAAAVLVAAGGDDDVKKHAQKAKEEKMLAESAAHLAAVRAARHNAEAAAAAGDEKVAESGAKAAASAEANVVAMVTAVENDDACSLKTKLALVATGKSAQEERVLADAAKYAAAAAAAKARAEKAAIGGDAEAASTAAGDAGVAAAAAAELSAKVQNDGSDPSSDLVSKVKSVAQKAKEDRMAADAAKFMAAAKNSRRAAEKAAEEGKLSEAEDASNAAIDAELGVTELAAEVEADADCSDATRQTVTTAVKRVTEDRQLADAAKLAAAAMSGKIDAQQAARDEDPEGAAAGAATAVKAAGELGDLVTQCEADQACSKSTLGAIVDAAKKADEDRMLAEAAKFVAQSGAARRQAEASAKAADAAGAAEAASAARDAEAGAKALVEQSNEAGASTATKKSLLEAASKATENRRLAEASELAAQAMASRKEAEAAAKAGDMYGAEAAASDCRTVENTAKELAAQVKEDRACSAMVKAAVADVARKTTEERQIAEAAKCAAMSASARAEAQKAAAAAAAPGCGAEEATNCATIAGDSEETIEEALKQIQEILGNLRSDKKVTNQTKSAIAKYAQPIIEDRHLAEAAKLAAQSSAARAIVEEMCASGDVASADVAMNEFATYEHEIGELKALVDSDSTLSAASKRAVGDAASTVKREKLTAEAAKYAALAEAAKDLAEHHASLADPDGAEAAAEDARKAESMAAAVVDAFEFKPGEDKDAHLVSQYARRAREARILAEAAALAARAARACEHTEAAATVADKKRGEAAKSDAKSAAAEMDILRRRVNGDIKISDGTKKAVSAYADSCKANADKAAVIVVPDKAVESKKVVEKAAKLAAAAAEARKKTEAHASERKVDEAKETLKACQQAASSAAALADEVKNSTLYDDSAKAQIQKHADAAQADALAAEQAIENIPPEEPEPEMPEKIDLEEDKLDANKNRKEGDEDKAEHFYGVTRSRFYMMPDSEEGVRLRDKAKAYAQEVAKALADTRKAVRLLLDPEAAEKRQQGADWKMAAANNAAAAVKRAQVASKEVEKLAQQAQERFERTKATPDATQKQIDRAGGTSVVVTGFSDVSIADAKEAEKLFKATYVIRPAKRRGNSTLKAAPFEQTELSGTRSSSANGDGTIGVARAKSGLGTVPPPEGIDQKKMSSAFADVLAATTVQGRQASLVAALGLSGSSADNKDGSNIASLDEIMSSYAFRVSDNAEGMNLRDLAKSFAEQAAKSKAEAQEAVAIHLDPNSAAGHVDKSGRRNSSQQGAQWKMHALNNADAASKRAKVNANKAKSVATQARERAEKVAKENPNNAELINAANATAAVVIGFSDSAFSDAGGAQEAFDSTSIFKRMKRGASSKKDIA